MVKRDKNLKNKNTKTAVTPAPEDISQESLNEDSEDLQEDQEVTKKEYKKSRMKNLEKNIEILEANDTKTGVIYIGHLPWGFDEVGLKKYFEQFGKITRILVPRSSKTGRMKGFAFIEFEEKAVAEIAAKTMNNYILFEKVLKCSVIEEASRYNLIFKKWKRKFKFNNKYEKYLKDKNKVKSKEELKDLVKLLLEKEEQKKNKLKEMGIKYEYPGYIAIIEKHKKTESKETSSKKKEKTSAKPTKKK